MTKTADLFKAFIAKHAAPGLEFHHGQHCEYLLRISNRKTITDFCFKNAYFDHGNVLDYKQIDGCKYSLSKGIPTVLGCD